MRPIVSAALALLLVGGGVWLISWLPLEQGSAKKAGSEVHEFLPGVYVTFAQREISGVINESVSGLPLAFRLRVVSDNFGDRLRGMNFLVEHEQQMFDQSSQAHSNGEDVLLMTDTGTLRVRVLEWLDYDAATASAQGVRLQFDFMLPKD
jgi:hypothetical protein